MAVLDSGSSAAGKANVGSNADAAYALSTNLPGAAASSGFASLVAENDDGTVTGSRYMKELELSEDYRLRVGEDQTMFNMDFAGTTIAQAHLQQNLSTMTAAQASGFLTLNSGNATASGNAANIRTYRTFPIYGTFPLYCEQWIREGNPTATNAISEWGLGYVSGTSAPTDGVFFRRASGGQLQGVICYNSSETVTSITTTSVPSRDGAGSYDATECNHYLITIHNDECEWWINDALVLKVSIPATSPIPVSAVNQPAFCRVYNSGVASAGRRVELGFINVSMGDQDANKPWAHILAGAGGGAYQTQPGNASAQTANWANSAAPASATLSNTAAGYTTLGGQWQFAASATNETDWALFGYTNPAGTSTLPGKTLYVTHIRVGETHVTGAAGVNATMFYWFAGTGSTAVSLATTDAAATVAPRKVALGGQSFLAAAAIGTQAAGFSVDFSSAPLVCAPGCFFHVGVKQLNGAATVSLVWRGTVTILGYFE